MARKARTVVVAKAPKARAADASSSPVLGRTWLPRLSLGFLTSEDDAEVLIEADNDVLDDSLIEALVESDALIESETDWLVEIETLILALSDSDTLNEQETDWLVETEALALCDSETDVETD